MIIRGLTAYKPSQTQHWALDQRSDGGVRTGNGKTHPPIHIFSEIRPISTDFLTNIFACFSRFFFAIIGRLLETPTKS